MSNNNNATIRNPDPNDEVERWKDKLYEEIKDLPKDQIGAYLDRKADAVFQRLQQTQHARNVQVQS